MSGPPKVQPIQLQGYNCKQSTYNEVVPKLPIRSMLVGPSGGGKTVLLTNMILDIYRDCFSRIYVWSPSINVDLTWKPVKYYVGIHIKPNDREQCDFDSYEPGELEQVINTQQEAIINNSRNITIYTRF